jgi:hypothetical protein
VQQPDQRLLAGMIRSLMFRYAPDGGAKENIA